MTGRLSALPVVLVALAAVRLMVESPAAQTHALAITRVAVVDVTNGRIIPDSTVVVDGSTISNVSSNARPPANAQIVDGTGRFLIPGLWDMHAHTEASGDAWLPLYVANGVTGIRDMGSALDYILRLRDATASGSILGPRIFAAGPILDDAPMLSQARAAAAR